MSSGNKISSLEIPGSRPSRREKKGRKRTGKKMHGCGGDDSLIAVGSLYSNLSSGTGGRGKRKKEGI